MGHLSHLYRVLWNQEIWNYRIYGLLYDFHHSSIGLWFLTLKFRFLVSSFSPLGTFLLPRPVPFATTSALCHDQRPLPRPTPFVMTDTFCQNRHFFHGKVLLTMHYLFSSCKVAADNSPCDFFQIFTTLKCYHRNSENSILAIYFSLILR